VAAFLSPFANSSPDGLERVAESKGFSETAQTSPIDSPLAGYQVGGEGGIAKAVAGVLGVGVTFGIGYAAVRLTKRTKARR
jgi:hypothetical protein